MKLKYDSKNISFKEYNIAQGVAAFRNRYIKNKETKIKSYITRFLEYGLLFFICYILLWILGSKLEISFCFFIAKFSFTMAIFCIIFAIFSVIGSYLNFIKSNFTEGIITIDDKGITDDTKDNLMVSFKWEGVKLLIIYKSLLIVVGNTPLFLLVKLENEEKVKKEILKYCNEEKCKFYL